MKSELKILLIVCLMLIAVVSKAQNISVEPVKDFLRGDTLHAKYGTVFTENDPYGRKTFAQWIVKDAELFHIELSKPVLFVAQFTVDYKGRNKKVRVLNKGNSAAAKLLTTAIEEAPRWMPFKQNGVSVPTEETLAIMLLPSKTPDGELRGATSIAPQYPEDGIVGFLNWVESRENDPDWRYSNANLLKKNLNLQVRFTIQINGEMTCVVEDEVNEKLKAAIHKLFAKCALWQPGIYVTRLCPYSFVLPIQIPAWNEKMEGETIERKSQNKKSQVQMDMEKRYQNRQQLQ